MWKRHVIRCIAAGLTDELLSLYKMETLEGTEHVMNVFAKGLLQQWLGHTNSVVATTTI